MFFLTAGGQISLAITEDAEDVETQVVFRIRGFASNAEAEDWAAQRRQSNASQ
jgi:hypothetical protein